jgi:hypothetical protein
MILQRFMFFKVPGSAMQTFIRAVKILLFV